MNVFEMIIGIVLISGVVSILRARYGSMRHIQEHDAGQPDGEATRLKDEVAQLKQRIAVLERLATDDNSARTLDREIEKLR